MKSSHRAAAALILLALVAAIYAPVANYPFITHDDPLYVRNNPAVTRGLSAEGIGWAFTTFELVNWHPLTWISYMTDVSLFGPSPGPMHVVNVLFHGANAVLLFLFLAGATGAPWRSLAVAALFAVHPLHVESVAWIAERKDVLCLFFLFLSLNAWTRYVEKPSWRRLLPVAVLHAMALLAKPMAVTFPVLLLVLDRWPFMRGPFARSSEGDARSLPPPIFTGYPSGSISALVVEKVPFFLLSAASSLITIAAQKSGGAVVSARQLPLFPRVGNAILSYAAYLGKAVYPRSLAIFYPHPWNVTEGNLLPPLVGSAILILVISGIAYLYRNRQPWLLSGWAWYMIALLPVIGIIQVGEQGMADRYAYLPLIGIYFAVAWGTGSLAAGRTRREWALAAVAASCVIALAVTARVQLSYWKNSGSLYSHAVAVTKRNYRALCLIGGILKHDKKLPEAEWAYREAVSIFPELGEGWGMLGLVLYAEGKVPEAEDALRRAIAFGQRGADEYQYLGLALQQRGLHPEAVGMLAEAARLKPESAQIRYNLALSEGFRGMTNEAEKSYREAIRLSPRFIEAYNNLGYLLMAKGRAAEAETLFNEALRINPNDPNVKENLARLRSGAKVEFPPKAAMRRSN
jgi:Flp pilus assembly protein TadD